MEKEFNDIVTSNINELPHLERASFVAGNTMCLLIVPFNEIIDWWLTETYDKFTTSNLYKQTNKLLINKVKEEMKTIITIQKAKYDSVSESIYFTYVDFYSDKMKEHVSKVQKLVYDEMVSHNVKNDELISYIETTRILMVLQTQAFNKLITDVSCNNTKNLTFTAQLRMKKFLLEQYSSYNCDKPLAFMQTLSDKLFVNAKGFNLNDNEELVKCVTDIQNIIANADYLDEAAEEALKSIKNDKD